LLQGEFLDLYDELNEGKIILHDHINHCLVDALETGDKKVPEDLNNAVDKFLK